MYIERFFSHFLYSNAMLHFINLPKKSFSCRGVVSGMKIRRIV